MKLVEIARVFGDYLLQMIRGECFNLQFRRFILESFDLYLKMFILEI